MTTTVSHTNRYFVSAIIVWVVITMFVSGFIIKADVDSAKNVFKSHTAALYNLIDQKIKINETIVESFSATISTLGEQDYDSFREYAKQMRVRYPHIYMFEIAEKVLDSEKYYFENNYKNKFYKDFKIKSFRYEAGRKWQAVNKKEYYFPITFMEPFPPGSQKVLGLDISANKFLVETLQNEVEEHASVSTKPFRLVEDELAYLIYKPIIKHGASISDHDHSFSLEDRYAILVILVESLFEEQSINKPNYTITLYHSDFPKDSADGVLYSQEGSDPGALESLIFPALVFDQRLDNKSQPFILLVEKRLGWDILSWWLLSAILIVSITALFLMLRYIKTVKQFETLRKQETKDLFYLANHDSLTGLANRNLMMDRFRHALEQAERSKTRLAVLFMDLNEFKKVNDAYGHAVGDKVLKSAAERLLACIRKGDTLARQSGDEFVLILENIKGKSSAEDVVEKITAAFEQSFSINGIQIDVGVSIGVAIYPEDGTLDSDLMEFADKNMYMKKSH